MVSIIFQMDSPEPKRHYEFRSWKIYPRVHYFFTRFKDVLVRFKKVEGLCVQLMCFSIVTTENIIQDKNLIFGNLLAAS